MPEPPAPVPAAIARVARAGAEAWLAWLCLAWLCLDWLGLAWLCLGDFTCLAGLA
jgi:hypothetical protein